MSCPPIYFCLPFRTKYLQSRHRAVPATDFMGCRLRAHAAAQRADLIRDVEARLLTRASSEVCPKPLHLLMAPDSASASGPRKHSISTPSVQGVNHKAGEEDALVLVSFVLTVRRELLVVDHTEEGLAALRPRSLGFLAPGVMLPPLPDQNQPGKALRRYPVVLHVHRSHHNGSIAGDAAAANQVLSSSVDAEDLHLYAPSRSQYDALRRAVESLSSPSEPMQSRLEPCVVEDGKEQDKEAAKWKGVATQEVTEDDLKMPARNVDLFDGTNLQPSRTSLPARHDADAEEVVNAAAAASYSLSLEVANAQKGASAAYSMEKYCALPGPENAAVRAEKLKERIAAAQESLLCTPPPPAVCTLLAKTAAEQAEVYSAWVAAAAAAKLSMSPFSIFKGTSDFVGGFDLNSCNKGDTTESGLLLTMHMELRAGALGLLAGLDTAMALEIRRFAMENARLQQRIGDCLATDSNIRSSWGCKAEAITAAMIKAGEPIILSGTTIQSFKCAMVSAHCIQPSVFSPLFCFSLPNSKKNNPSFSPFLTASLISLSFSSYVQIHVFKFSILTLTINRFHQHQNVIFFLAPLHTGFAYKVLVKLKKGHHPAPKHCIHIHKIRANKA